jgi:hypothetical protein
MRLNMAPAFETVVESRVESTTNSTAMAGLRAPVGPAATTAAGQGPLPPHGHQVHLLSCKLAARMTAMLLLIPTVTGVCQCWLLQAEGPAAGDQLRC